MGLVMGRSLVNVRRRAGLWCRSGQKESTYDEGISAVIRRVLTPLGDLDLLGMAGAA